MKRTQICLTQLEYDTLKKIADRLGIGLSELIRRILDNYIKENPDA